MHRDCLVAVDQEEGDQGHQPLLAEVLVEGVLVANREHVALATVLEYGKDDVGHLVALVVGEGQFQQLRTGDMWPE